MARLIDADALKEKICNNVYPIADFFNSRDYGMFWTGGIEKAIDEAPTIDAEPTRHGKLMRTEAYPHKLYCGECYNTLIPNDEAVEQNWMLKPKYCMYCGARMDADEISNIAKESADKISKALKKVRAKGMQKQNIKEDDKL